MMNNNMDNLGMNPIGMNAIGMNPIGMNNMGMNAIGMNPMLMNNFGIMGMNNPLNLMNENAVRIKNIIQPYENKIKELEEIIRQKDFEIALLKDKLNNFNAFTNNINMNQNNIMMMQNINPESNKQGIKLIISYANFMNEIKPKKFECFENDITYKLIDKMIPNYQWNLMKLTCEEKKIHPFLTIKENGLKNGSVVKINFAINIIFKDCYGSAKCISIDEKKKKKKAIKFYLLRIGKQNCYDEFSFLYNAQKLNVEDKTPIKVIFKNNMINPKVTVNENNY